MNVKSRVRIGAVVAAAALGVGVLGGPAFADPAAGDYRQLAGVGSDTIQDVLNALGDEVGGGDVIASYDATGSTTVKTRATGCVLPRPNGSSAGIDALRASVDNATGCLDFARSSRIPADTSSQDLTWIPFAKDAVSIAVREDSALSTGLDLTTAQLRAIFTCQTTTLNGVALTPLLPQAGSGTRTFFEEKLGLADSQVGSCVGTMQEHNGVELNSAGDIAPYSIAQYLSQITGTSTDRHGDSVLGKINGSEPFTEDGTLNTAFTYNRDVFNVVPTSKLSTPAIAATFVGASSDVCDESATIEEFGFGTVANCGATTLKGER